MNFVLRIMQQHRLWEGLGLKFEETGLRCFRVLVGLRFRLENATTVHGGSVGSSSTKWNL